MARPSPRLAPVTSAVLPSKLNNSRMPIRRVTNHPNNDSSVRFPEVNVVQ